MSFWLLQYKNVCHTEIPSFLVNNSVLFKVIED